MKKIVLIGLLALGLGAIGTGCIPPPPRSGPKPPGAPPAPPGPSAVVVPHNFGELTR